MDTGMRAEEGKTGQVFTGWLREEDMSRNQAAQRGPALGCGDDAFGWPSRAWGSWFSQVVGGNSAWSRAGGKAVGASLEPASERPRQSPGSVGMQNGAEAAGDTAKNQWRAGG